MLMTRYSPPCRFFVVCLLGIAGCGEEAGGILTIDREAKICTAQTSCGPVRGTLEAGVCAFRGIPYAEAPLGELRFRPPVERACSGEGIDASDFGPVCPQPTWDDNGEIIAVHGSEDCLRLNLWVPADADAALPVLVYVHGGFNTRGSASGAVVGASVYDGREIARRTRSIMVTVNYRLGPLGFLYLPSLRAESPDQSAGNYGLLDQIQALRWLSTHTAAFGGDPERVLLFGQSSGAYDACAILASPLAAGLFSSVVLQSGQCFANRTEKATQFGAEYLSKTGCADAADVPSCLRSMDLEAALRAIPEMPTLLKGSNRFLPVVDGWVLTGRPLDVIASGRHNHVPLMLGSTAQETSQDLGGSSEQLFQITVAWLTGGVGDWTERIRSQYPVGQEFAQFPSYADAWIALTTDLFFGCSSRRTARAMAAGQDEPVYRYLFSRRLDERGAFHGLDLAFLFQHLEGYDSTEEDRSLAGEMAESWRRFAASGNPSGGAVEWPRYDPDTDPYLELNVPLVAGERLHSERCDLWDQFLVFLDRPEK